MRLADATIGLLLTKECLVRHWLSEETTLVTDRRDKWIRLFEQALRQHIRSSVADDTVVHYYRRGRGGNLAGIEMHKGATSQDEPARHDDAPGAATSSHVLQVACAQDGTTGSLLTPCVGEGDFPASRRGEQRTVRPVCGNVGHSREARRVPCVQCEVDNEVAEPFPKLPQVCQAALNILDELVTATLSSVLHRTRVRARYRAVEPPPKRPRSFGL